MTTVAHRFILMAAKQDLQDFVPNLYQIAHFAKVWIKK